MSGDDPIRVGFIGAGGICRTRHLPGLARIAGVEVVAVCNRTEASSRAIADEFNIGSVETDWQRLVQRDDVDAVFIGTWPYTHAEMSVAALEFGKHVFCQARMAATFTGAQVMVDAADRHPELVSMICPPPHRMPWEPYIRKVLADGALGELRQARLVCVDGSNLGPLTWREQVEYSGVQIMQVGIWAETLHAWLGEYDTLTATCAVTIADKPDDTGQPYTIHIPQLVSISGVLRSGLHVIETHSGLSPTEKANYLVIDGSDGTLRIDAMSQVSMGKPGGELQPVDVPADLQRDWWAESQFIDAVRKARLGAPPASRRVDPDFHDGMKYMRKVAAVHRSALTGRAVRLSEL